MNTMQFGRKASLMIGHDAGDAIELSGLRFTFRVQRGDQQTPNSARIRVYNVSDNTAQKVQTEFKRVVLQAGYAGSYGIIFDGTLLQVRRGRENPTDTYLDITAADGDMAYNFAVVNTTLAAGSAAEDHVKACTAEMAKYGVAEGYRPALPSAPLSRGKVMFGMARDCLEAVARSTQTLWSIQDGQLLMVPETSYVPGDIPDVSHESGMIGQPEQTQNGITVRMLLNPSIKIGRLIHLGSGSIQQAERSLGSPSRDDKQDSDTRNRLSTSGYYYVMNNEHWGDTRGNDWYTEATCLAVDATPIDTPQLVRSDPGKTDPVAPKLGVIKPYG